MAYTISVVSGKGGVGKSTFVANIGAALAASGHSVAILDTDLGLRAQDALLGLENKVVYDLLDVMNGTCGLETALIEVPAYPGLQLLAAAQFTRARALDPKKLRSLISRLKETHEFILIDGPAGLEKGFRNILASGSDRFILLVTPDDLCVRDGERAFQIMDAKKLERPCLVVNRLDNDLIQSGEMMNAESVAELLDLPLLGEIPEDPVVYRSILRHIPLIQYESEARNAILRIASRLTGASVPLPRYGSRKLTLWKKLFRSELKEVTPLDSH